MEVIIQEGNNLIANFDCKTKDTDSDWFRGFDFKYYGISSCHKTQLKYHSSWDWIIPAIIKFRNLEIDHYLYISNIQAIDDSVIDEYDIIQPFYVLVAAIKWYNQTQIINNPSPLK